MGNLMQASFDFGNGIVEMDILVQGIPHAHKQNDRRPFLLPKVRYAAFSSLLTCHAGRTSSHETNLHPIHPERTRALQSSHSNTMEIRLLLFYTTVLDMAMFNDS